MSPEAAGRWRSLAPGLRRALFTGAIVCGASLCLALPAVPILAGVLAIAAAALHAWSDDLRPLVQPLLRVPVARAARRHGHLALVATAGVALVACGFGGAVLRGQLRAGWAEEARRRESVDGDVQSLLESARVRLAAGLIDDAEMALLDAGTVGGGESGLEDEVAELLERVQRAKDPKLALGALVGLSDGDFAAFERGSSVPDELTFPESALTARSVHLALEQLDEARRRRGSL